MIKRHDNNRFGGNGNKAMKRDGYVCLKCGMTNQEHLERFKKSLSVDHIDGKGRYSKDKNHNLDNLQTLCLPCHGKKDAIGCPKKLNDSQIEEIRQLYKNGMVQRKIASKYGVSQVFVSYVVIGKRRKAS